MVRAGRGDSPNASEKSGLPRQREHAAIGVALVHHEALGLAAHLATAETIALTDPDLDLRPRVGFGPVLVVGRHVHREDEPGLAHLRRRDREGPVVADVVSALARPVLVAWVSALVDQDIGPQDEVVRPGEATTLLWVETDDHSYCHDVELLALLESSQTEAGAQLARRVQLVEPSHAGVESRAGDRDVQVRLVALDADHLGLDRLSRVVAPGVGLERVGRGRRYRRRFFGGERRLGSRSRRRRRGFRLCRTAGASARVCLAVGSTRCCYYQQRNCQSGSHPLSRAGHRSPQTIGASTCMYN